MGSRLAAAAGVAGEQSEVRFILKASEAKGGKTKVSPIGVAERCFIFVFVGLQSLFPSYDGPVVGMFGSAGGGGRRRRRAVLSRPCRMYDLHKQADSAFKER